MEHADIDIIVPFYNASTYLDRCIASILCQGYKQFTLLLIDDGSSDDSLLIAHKYASDDTRIRIIEQLNAGVSTARNRGLEFATSEWIMFVDADDYLVPGVLSDLLEGAREGVDLCVSDYRILNQGKERIVGFPEGVLSQNSFGQLFKCYDFQWSTAVWGKLFRKQTIDRAGLRFNTGMHHSEDLVFLYQYLCHTCSISFSGKVGYNYIIGNSSSLTRRFHSFEIEMNGIQFVEEATRDLISFLHLRDDAIIGKMMQPVIFCQMRALNAIYGHEIHRGAETKERLTMIRSVGIEKYKDYFYPIYGWKEALLIFILVKVRWFWLYDFIRSESVKRA